ncbi:hypothetical protein [Haloparvum sedimenti]|uniref:hypothetical protein n=1 Tax=Haloparvum sedimenti TaxID=1678448 RepID=UPI00071E7596|nr:hypothetical protein [Haloparvum sedimenti]
MSADRPGAGKGDGDDPTLANGDRGPENPNVDDLLAKLDALEEVVDDPDERRKVRQTISLVERMPGSAAFTERISKYTTRDMAEAFVGAVLFALPLLVEGGVFEIAAWFASVRVGPVPVMFLGNVVFVVAMTVGLLYGADFRQVQINNPILGVIPRRLVGVLGVSLIATVLLMVLWGRLFEAGPTNFEAVSRISVVWAAAAFGAGLGDILPGESVGDDIAEHIDDIGDRIGFDD